MALKRIEKYCTNCNEKLITGAMFCSMCGTKVEEEKKCKGCGTKLAKEAMFCHVCGEKYGEEQQSMTNDDWGFKFSNEDREFIFDTNPTSIEFDSGSVVVDGAKDMVIEDCSNKVDLVAENALLSLCPDTVCTHTREYYKGGAHFTRTLYNHRLYWITGKEVWCSKEDGTEKILVISKEQLATSDWSYIVVNYYGIFVYRLEYVNQDEDIRYESQIRWYGFDGKLKKELTLRDSKHCLSDIYIYGSKLFFSLYTGKVRRNYSVGYYDILTEEKETFDIPKKEIHKVIGNDECLMFQFSDSNTKNSWFIYPYKTRHQGKCYSQIKYFDLKHRRVWVDDNKLVVVSKPTGKNWDNGTCTSLIEYELEGCEVIPLTNPRRWLYRQGSLDGCMEYFDGTRFYRAPWYYIFISYNEDSVEYKWNSDALHGAYDKSVILGEYIYLDEATWIAQYKATHIQEPSIRIL